MSCCTVNKFCLVPFVSRVFRTSPIFIGQNAEFRYFPFDNMLNGEDTVRGCDEQTETEQNCHKVLPDCQRYTKLYIPKNNFSLPSDFENAKFDLSPVQSDIQSDRALAVKNSVRQLVIALGIETRGKKSNKMGVNVYTLLHIIGAHSAYALIMTQRVAVLHF